MASTEEKLAVGKQEKEVGDQAFKAGQITDALRSYHRALMYVLGLDKNPSNAMAITEPVADAAKNKEKTEVDEVIEKIYANMSACHLKNKNWQRALETSNKALAKNENNYKAMFRKAKALGEIGYYEKAEKTLEELAQKSPEDAEIANSEIQRIKTMEKEKDRVNNQKLKGFLSKEKKSPAVQPEATASTSKA